MLMWQYSPDKQQCDTITIRAAMTGFAAQSMVTCVATENVFLAPNTLYRETWALTSATPSTATATATATMTVTRTGQTGESVTTEGRASRVVAAAWVGVGVGAAAVL